MDLIDRDTLDDTFLRLNEDGWELTRYEHKRMESVLFEMPTVEAIPLNVIDEIKAEINTKIQAHSSPKDDVFFCLDYAYRVIDEKVKEYTE